MLKFIKDFSLRNKGWFVLDITALFLSLVFLPQATFPQSRDYFPIVTRITVEIDGKLGGKNIRELIAIKEGEEFSLKKVASSIRQIYKTGLYSDIQVLKEGEQKIELTFFLVKKIFVRRIDFFGEAKIPRKKLKEGLHLISEGNPFSDKDLDKAVEELKNILNKEGYFYSEVEPVIDKNPKTSNVDVFFKICLAKRFIIDKIAFSGDVIIPEAELRKKIKTKEGTEFIPSVLEEDIEKLRGIYNSRHYHQVEIEVKEKKLNEEKGNVSLVLGITPHEKIEIEVRGAEVPLSLLKPIWEAEIFEEWGLAEGEAKIIGYMRNKGHLFSSVDSFVERKNNKVRIVYKVSPGERYRIQDISFEGLNYFTPSQIGTELEIKKNIPILSKIIGARLFELPRELIFLYKTRGFPDTRVDLTFIREGKKVKPVFYVEEGRQEKIKSISVKGNALFSQEQILNCLNIFKGCPFYQPDIQKDIERIEIFYLNKGVRGTEVKAQVQNIGNDLFSVNFSINEGKRVKIESIIITGNEITKKSTIRREFLIKEGDYAFYDSIRETKARLERLGVFTEVRVEEIPISPEKENLLFRFREGERNYVGLGLGLETKNEPRSFAVWNNVVRPRGTAEFIRSNIFGSAAQFSLIGQVSLREKRGVVSWEQPYFFGLRMQTFLNAWLEREQRKSYSFDRRGISLSAIKSLSDKENMVLLTSLRFARTTLFELLTSESEVDRQLFPFSATSISGSFIWDKRNDPFNPEKGYFFSSVLEWAYPLFNAESDYLKTFSKYQVFVPIFLGCTFSSTTRFGLGRGRIPIHERFFAGGSNSFRGVEFDELGPKDPNSLKPVGGKALLLFNFELNFPLISSFKSLSGVAFYDAGNVFERRKQVSLYSIQNAVGLGLRYRTPLGPVRFEIGWNLNAPEGEKDVLAFITIGNIF